MIITLENVTFGVENYIMRPWPILMIQSITELLPKNFPFVASCLLLVFLLHSFYLRRRELLSPQTGVPALTDATNWLPKLPLHFAQDKVLWFLYYRFFPKLAGIFVLLLFNMSLQCIIYLYIRNMFSYHNVKFLRPWNQSPDNKEIHRPRGVIADLVFTFPKQLSYASALFVVTLLHEKILKPFLAEYEKFLVLDFLHWGVGMCMYFFIRRLVRNMSSLSDSSYPMLGFLFGLFMLVESADYLMDLHPKILGAIKEFFGFIKPSATQLSLIYLLSSPLVAYTLYRYKWHVFIWSTCRMDYKNAGTFSILWDFYSLSTTTTHSLAENMKPFRHILQVFGDMIMFPLLKCAEISSLQDF